MTFIKTFIKRSLFVFGAIALAITVFLFGMRFADGPWIVVSGGPFTTGTVVSEEPDWSSLRTGKKLNSSFWSQRAPELPGSSNTTAEYLYRAVI